MRLPKVPDINRIVAKLERDVECFKELAPLSEGKPLLGIREYSELLTDNEWMLILEYVKRGMLHGSN